MVKIRSQRFGAHKKPFYRIVATDSRNPRDGRFIEIVGTYNPLTTPETVNLDVEKIEKWVNNGAKLTAMLMKHYNIPLDRVITHNDVTGKDCPHDILHRYGFDNFKELIKSYLN